MRPATLFSVDAIVDGSTLTLELCCELNRLAPFGLGNPGVTLLVDGCELTSLDTVGEGKHLRFRVRQQGRDLAKSLGVTPTPPKDFALAKAHVEAMKSLRGLKGKSFDRAYLQHEVDYHNAVIDAVTGSVETLKSRCSSLRRLRRTS